VAVGRLGGNKDMEKKKALGKGLSSLIPDPTYLDDSATPQKSYFYCDIENVEPNHKQPRKIFDKERLQELADSIKERGILQPIIVKKTSEFKYEIIAGERRWRAAQKALLKQVPVIIRESSGAAQLEDALIENIQREDLNPMEEALAYHNLIELHKYTQDQLAKKVGKNRTTITNALRLIQLPEKLRNLVITRQITSGHARALLSIEDPALQMQLANRIIKEDLSVRQIESLSRAVNKPTEKVVLAQDPYTAALEGSLSTHFKARVKIISRGKKGKIEIQYHSEDELNRIIGQLKA
jgi:ParB family transcriptional regulator, chromosome partitioning protein